MLFPFYFAVDFVAVCYSYFSRLHEECDSAKGLIVEYYIEPSALIVISIICLVLILVLQCVADELKIGIMLTEYEAAHRRGIQGDCYRKKIFAQQRIVQGMCIGNEETD